MHSTTAARSLLQATRTLSLSSTRRVPQQWQRAASTKHPKNFVPPTQEDLDELRERTREFVRREIPEELAQATDHKNEFPMELWGKFGDAGYVTARGGLPRWQH